MQFVYSVAEHLTFLINLESGREFRAPVDSSISIKRQRILNIPGVINLRDIGGYPAGNRAITRWGTILRSGTMNGFTPDAGDLFEDFRISTVLDLRRDEELPTDPQPDLGNGHRAVTYRQVSLLTDQIQDARRQYGYQLPDVYRAILDKSQDQIGEAVGVLAEPGALPAIVRCTAGKDRTGLVIALLLRTVGVPDDTIAYDYALSQQCMDHPEFIEFQQAHVLDPDADWETYRKTFLISPAEFMRDALQYVDSEYGSACGYLLEAGVDLSAQNHLRQALVEPSKR